MVKFELINVTTETAFPSPFFKEIDSIFTVPLNRDQKITFARVFARIEIIEAFGLGNAKAEVFFNGRLIADQAFDIVFDKSAFVVDMSIPIAAIKPNQQNEVKIELEQGFVAGGITWSLFADFFYQVVNEDTGEMEEPTNDPVIEDPRETGKDFGQSIFEDLRNFFFGSFGTSIKTIAVGAAVVGGVIVALRLTKKTPQVRAIRLVKSAV